MSHFQNLRLKQHKGLKSAVLYDLGRINVFCGPNNSGKTTILECIAGATLHAIGAPLDAIAISRIKDRSMEGRQWTDMRFESAYPKIASEVAAKQPVWFNDESNLYWTTLVGVWQKYFANSVPGSESAVLKFFQAEVGVIPSVVLIPAKRRLEAANSINSSESIEPSGSGVLNFLFFAKNQDHRDPLRQHFERIAAGFREITEGYTFDVFLKSGNQIELRFRWPNSNWVQAEDCGLGLRDLLTILYFGIASEHEGHFQKLSSHST